MCKRRLDRSRVCVASIGLMSVFFFWVRGTRQSFSRATGRRRLDRLCERFALQRAAKQQATACLMQQAAAARVKFEPVCRAQGDIGENGYRCG